MPVMPEGSIFRSTDQARLCLWESVTSLGLAAEASPSQVRFQPLKARLVESSVFERLDREAQGRVEFDSAYWLRDDEPAWAGEGPFAATWPRPKIGRVEKPARIPGPAVFHFFFASGMGMQRCTEYAC